MRDLQFSNGVVLITAKLTDFRGSFYLLAGENFDVG